MQDLKEVTQETHYENYRAECIHKMTQMVVQERKRRWEGAQSGRRREGEDRDVHVKMYLHAGCVCQHFSLLERRHNVAEADFPLPLAAVDTERERLILEKDEEVHKLVTLQSLQTA